MADSNLLAGTIGDLIVANPVIHFPGKYNLLGYRAVEQEMDKLYSSSLVILVMTRLHG